MSNILDSVAVNKTDWQSICDGNQRFWTVPSNFELNDYAVDSNSLTKFTDWGTDGNNKVIRLWSKW